MSHVTGVILSLRNEEEPIINLINNWLTQRKFDQLTQIDRYFSGSRHPQIAVFGAGYNFFPSDEFIEFLQDIPWDCPKTVHLLLNEEDDLMVTWSPATAHLTKVNDERIDKLTLDCQMANLRAQKWEKAYCSLKESLSTLKNHLREDLV